jgi:hypothetical protein
LQDTRLPHDPKSQGILNGKGFLYLWQAGYPGRYSVAGPDSVPMKNLAPEITRQRLIIEGYFSREIGRSEILAFFAIITKELGLRAYGEPTIHQTGGDGRAINQGFDAFIPLIDSGIALYVWGNAKFFSTVIYTCKEFDEKAAVRVAREFFGSKEVAHKSF